MNRLELGVLGGRPQRKCQPHHAVAKAHVIPVRTLSLRSHTAKADLDQPAVLVFAKLLHYKITLFPLTTLYSFGRKPPCTAHTSGVGS